MKLHVTDCQDVGLESGVGAGTDRSRSSMVSSQKYWMSCNCLAVLLEYNICTRAKGRWLIGSFSVKKPHNVWRNGDSKNIV